MGLTIRIRLNDILVDLDGQTDLAAMPTEQAAKITEESYGFLAPALSVAVENGMAVIDADVDPQTNLKQAERVHNRAVADAQRGQNQAAIEGFKKVLSLAPARDDVRRDLAMVYYETGNAEKAKRYLVEALRLNPDNAQSWLVLANVFLRLENDPARAERFYRKALELAPQDVYVLNGYGALLAKLGRYAEAREFFQRAVDSDATYPNSHYGLALVYMNQDQPEAALSTLDGLFVRTTAIDVRSAPVYEQARTVYGEANRKLAEKWQGLTADFLSQRRKAIEQETGLPVEVVEDNSIGTTATTQLAWAHHRDRHIVKHRSGPAPIVAHSVAHEFEHISLEFEARRAGRSRVFMTTPATDERSRRFLLPYMGRLAKSGYPERVVAETMMKLIHGLANQLLNIPLDMVIESRLSQRSEVIHPSQFVAIQSTMAEGLKAVTDKRILELTPAPVHRASSALNCAYAMFADTLYEGRTEYAAPYKRNEAYPVGKRLFEIWQGMAAHLGPGDEFKFVDEFARVLKLEQWFEWQSGDNNGDTEKLAPAAPEEPVAPEGATNPALLDAKSPATAMYCLGALETFEGMTNDEIFGIVGEIALVGRSGIDYSSAEKRYTLRALDGREFTGLQLLAMMYVGFAKVDPTVDTGLPFKEAYETALSLHEVNRNRGDG